MMRIKFNTALVTGLALLVGGCAGDGNSGPPAPKIRAINGLQGVSLATVSVTGIQDIINLPYATLSGTPHTPYVNVAAGAQAITFASSATPTTTIASSNRTFLNGDLIDAIAYGTTTPAVLQLADDSSIPANTSVRFANASPSSGAVDFIVAGGVYSGTNTAVGGVAPAQSSGAADYADFATTGTFQISVYPAGQDTGTPLLTESVTLKGGTRWTFVLLDSATAGGTPLLLQVQDNVLTDTSTSTPNRGR